MIYGLFRNRRILNICLVSVLLSMLLPTSMLAAQEFAHNAEPLRGIVDSHEGANQANDWLLWIDHQISQHPAIMAAQQRLEAALSQTKELEQALYNPQLETEFEREGDQSNYRAGLSQQIDWQGKARLRDRQAVIKRTQAALDHQLFVQQRYVEVLRALVDREAAAHRAALATAGQSNLEALLDQLKKRQQAGDIGALGAELAFLSLSQGFNETVHAMVELQSADARLKTYLPDWLSKQSELLASVLLDQLFLCYQSGESKISLDNGPLVQGQKAKEHCIGAPLESDLEKHKQQIEEIIETQIEHHPVVASARTRWQLLRNEAELIALNTRADPRVGFSVGSTDDDPALGVRFSIPLKGRGINQIALKAARQRESASAALYRAEQSRQGIVLASTQTTLTTYHQHYQRWQWLVAGKSQRIQNTLKKRWRGGDISTTQYLLALQQQTDGQLAGVELRRQVDLARVEWLFQTGKLVGDLQSAEDNKE